MNYCIDCNKEIGKKSVRCCSCSKKEGLNPMWSGKSVGYNAIHAWVERNYAKPSKCELCGKTTEALDASNIDGKYTRDRTTWQWICRSCHMKQDGRLKKMWTAERDVSGTRNPNYKHGKYVKECI